MANSKSSPLNPDAPVFHSRAAHETRNSMLISSQDGLRQSCDPYQPPEKDTRGYFSPNSPFQILTQGSVDLDPGMVNSSLQKSYAWNYKSNGSFNNEIGSSKRSDLLAPFITRVSSFQRKVPSPSSTNRTSFWSGYGQAVGNFLFGFLFLFICFLIVVVVFVSSFTNIATFKRQRMCIPSQEMAFCNMEGR